jgi:hypothetical protein
MWTGFKGFKRKTYYIQLWTQHTKTLNSRTFIKCREFFFCYLLDYCLHKRENWFCLTTLYISNETPTWCNTVQVSFLQDHSTCFGRKRPSSGVFKTSTAATGTCVIVVGQSSELLLNTPDDGRLRPKHVEWPCRNKTCTVLHQVGVSFELYYDARKHKIIICSSLGGNKVNILDGEITLSCRKKCNSH